MDGNGIFNYYSSLSHRKYHNYDETISKKKTKTFKPKFKICIFELHIKFPSFGLDKKNPRIKLVSHTKNETAKISAFKKQNKKKTFILFYLL